MLPPFAIQWPTLFQSWTFHLCFYTSNLRSFFHSTLSFNVLSAARKAETYFAFCSSLASPASFLDRPLNVKRNLSQHRAFSAQPLAFARPLMTPQLAKDTAAAVERITYILQEKYCSVGCLYWKILEAEHTHGTCPKRLCWDCKNIGHLKTKCPHRLHPYAHSASFSALLAARKKRSHRFHFLQNRELEPPPTRVDTALLYFAKDQFDCRASLTLQRVQR